MRRVIFIFVLTAWLCGPGANSGRAQTHVYSEHPPPADGGNTQMVDGVAARIEDDILTESEVRELGAFQLLVDGQAKPRLELIRELADQWVIRGEANTAKFSQPAAETVERAYQQFVKQFPSTEEFQKRCTAAGLTEAGVRRMLREQLYLSSFLDYRFRPAAQVDDEQIETYYNDEFAPQLKARGEAVPALDDVEETIREVLVQRAISDRATKWLDETREHLKIDIVARGDGA
jgi:hypothetical protein